MPAIITNDNSNFATSGDAFKGTGPDTLTVKQDGFLIASAAGSVAGARLSGGPWTVAIDGAVTSINGIGLILDTASSLFTSKITIGTEGDIYGFATGIHVAHAATVTNKGYVFASSGSALNMATAGTFTITNSGTFDGNIGINLSGDGVHTIKNSGLIFGVTTGLNATGVAGIEKVTNTGMIDGPVKLGGGDDSFTNSGKGVVIFGTAATPGLIDMGAGNDKFLGGAGIDSLVDGAGNDTYTLGAGNDLFKAVSTPLAGEFDKIDGGTGNDTFDFSSAASGVAINLDTKTHGLVDKLGFYDVDFKGSTESTNDASAAFVVVASVKNFENVKGSVFFDDLFGSAAANVLEGNNGDDYLWGLAGNDSLSGGNGNDFLFGGTGKDTLTGGAGTDTFFVLKITDSGITDATRDSIKDFQGAGPTAGDVIDLLSIDAISGGADDGFTFLATANSKFTGHAGELRYRWAGLDTIIEGDVNGDKKADFSIAIESIQLLNMSATDFIL